MRKENSLKTTSISHETLKISSRIRW